MALFSSFTALSMASRWKRFSGGPNDTWMDIAFLQRTWVV
jgi:hypothetical protein